MNVMNVKKHALIIALITVLCCSPACLAASDEPTVYDPSVPPEERCTVMLATTLTVTGFDGEEVRWRAKGLKSWLAIEIPAGAHDFILDYSRTAGAQGQTHVAKAVHFRYEDFVAGHTYRMWGAEGAEPRGFAGMFKDIEGSMKDTVSKKFTVMVEDITK